MAISKEILNSIAKSEPNTPQARAGYFLVAFLEYLKRCGYKETSLQDSPEVEISDDHRSAMDRIRVLTADELVPGRTIAIFVEENQTKTVPTK